MRWKGLFFDKLRCRRRDNFKVRAMNDFFGQVLSQEQQRGIELERILMPHARKQRDEFFGQKKRFVHYTSADAAIKIIKSKRLWMRNTTCMSDYREVQHGFEMLLRFFSDEDKKKRFVQALDACFPGAANEAINLFDQYWNDTRSNTYIASISEHNDAEDFHGRLSMWRAFGGNTAKVAIVFRVPFLSPGADDLHIIFSPVAYLDEPAVQETIENVIKNIIDKREFICSFDRNQIVANIFTMLYAAVVCLKHPGFHEEIEWRVIHGPNRIPSPLVEHSTEFIAGVPQIVYKLPLDKTVSPALADLDLARIFDRLIIGPSPYAWAMFQAFADALKACGVADAEQRIYISGIPIRP